jgi:hypothetical protein
MVTKEASDIGRVSELKAAGDRPHAKYERLIARAKEFPAPTTIVVHPCDETSLRGAVEAAEAGIIFPIFVGRLPKFQQPRASMVLISNALKSSMCRTVRPRRQKAWSSYAAPKASS